MDIGGDLKDVSIPDCPFTFLWLTLLTQSSLRKQFFKIIYTERLKNCVPQFPFCMQRFCPCGDERAERTTFYSVL